MAFLQGLFQTLPLKLPPISLMQQAHSDEYEYGTRGRHAKPCRACSDFQSWLQTNKSKQTSQSFSASAKTDSSSHGKDCPLDKDELGRNSWSLLHTMAAYYPEEPSGEEQSIMRNFIVGLGRFYPCESCAIDFRRDMAEDPPDTSNRVALANWWCRIHNRVNRKLNKPEFDCSKVDERWLDGWKDGSCG